MNENELTLIDKLATKLGTTSEQMWNVLLAQANVRIVQESIFILATVIFCIALWRTHKKLSGNMPNQTHNYYYESELKETLMKIAVIIGIAAILISIAGIMNIITCIFNPDYFALDQILSTLKPD